jgi:hypothetical protein
MTSVTVLDRRDVTLFDALWAFFQEHQYCGDLDRSRCWCGRTR